MIRLFLTKIELYTFSQSQDNIIILKEQHFSFFKLQAYGKVETNPALFENTKRLPTNVSLKTPLHKMLYYGHFLIYILALQK